jgi:hypothetical protein
MIDVQELIPTYAGFGGKSYITFTVSEKEELICYQVEMLAKNRIDFLLPLSVQRLNNNWKLSYDITSKIPLGKVLERKCLKYGEFASILKQIGKLSAKLKDYLLDISSVIFNNSYIYCDPSDLSLYFMYFPVKNADFSSDTIKDFLRNLILNIRLTEDSSGSILKRLLDVLKSETFTPEMLLKCINSELRETFEDRLAGFSSDEGNEGISLISETPDQRQKNGTMNCRENRNNREKNGETHGGFKHPLKSYIVAGAANAFFVGLLVYMLFLRRASNDITGTVLGLALIGFAANYFIFTRLFSDEKKTGDCNVIMEASDNNIVKSLYGETAEKVIAHPKRSAVYVNKMVGSCMEEFRKVTENKAHESDCKSHDEVKEIQPPGLSVRTYIENSEPFSGTAHTGMGTQDRTVILGYASGNIPYLQSHSCPGERIYITKDSVLLGRLSDSVDYAINNRAVGKIHAEIVRKDDGYYIIDLNSVNGTYVNNERITCSTEVKLKNGDIVTLANESYTFVV